MKLLKSIPLALTALALGAPSHAAERLSLANGFDLVCHHHALVEGHVRVYLQPSDSDYVEFLPEAITAVETLPDPVPVPAPESQPAPPASTKDALLTPADLHQLLSKAGSEHNVDEDLLASIVKAESGGHTRALSHAGARGLMQLMPGTARQLGVADSFEPRQNVQGGATYLDALLTHYHDNLALALTAYNAGPEAVDRYRGIPPYRETRLYVAFVIHEFNRRVTARQKLARQSLASAAAH